MAHAHEWESNRTSLFISPNLAGESVTHDGDDGRRKLGRRHTDADRSGHRRSAARHIARSFALWNCFQSRSALKRSSRSRTSLELVNFSRPSNPPVLRARVPTCPSQFLRLVPRRVGTNGEVRPISSAQVRRQANLFVGSSLRLLLPVATVLPPHLPHDSRLLLRST